ncbi:MAG: hypothetical protein EXS02_06200 [Planctomycetes bacterium]|nr:hypothetical protein [Planctomycetota bacterium]
MSGAFDRVARHLLAIIHTSIGWLAFHLGGTVAARLCFERVLSLGSCEFVAYVHLGRIALGDGDYAGYRREMANARAADPERFRRLNPRVDGLEPRFDGTPFDETGERATWRSVRPSASFLRRTAVHSVELPIDSLLTDALNELQRHAENFATSKTPPPRDDFSSADERARFREQPPIGNDEVRLANLEDLSRRLSG